MISMLSYLPMGVLHGKRLLNRLSFDIVNTHFVLPTGPVGDYLARHGGLPNVLSVHGGDLYDPSKRSSPHRHLLLRIWIRRLLKRADKVVAQSKNTSENVQKFYTPDVDVIRIPLGIKRPPKGEAQRSEYRFSDTAILMVTVGRLVARKAVHRLISMMKVLDSNAHLLILGDGPMQGQLQQFSEELGLNKRVHFLGHVSEADKFRILRMSDIFVSASQHEGFGLVYLEALACGLPVICYDYGGQTDFLEDEVTGGLVSLNNDVAFIDRCRQISSDAELRYKMGRNNLAHVEPYFIDHCAAQYEDLFARVIARHRKR